MEYPNKGNVQERAAHGEPISQDEATSLAQEERDMTGWGPVPGGTAGITCTNSLQKTQPDMLTERSDGAKRSRQTDELRCQSRRRRPQTRGGDHKRGRCGHPKERGMIFFQGNSTVLIWCVGPRSWRSTAARRLYVVVRAVDCRPERAGSADNLLGGSLHEVAERTPEEHVRQLWF